MLITLLTGCGSAGVHQAETLPTPLPGSVQAAHAHGTCGSDGCPVTYRVRFTNPMDREANVQECSLVDRTLLLPLMSVAGVHVAAHATKSATATAVLRIAKTTAEGLVGERITCTGLDWHGDPPL